MALRSQLSRSSLRRSGGGSSSGGTVADVTVTTPVADSASADQQLQIQNNAGPHVLISQTIAAGWKLGALRVFAVDGTNGNDANVGFADTPVAPSAGDYATACAAAGAVAKQTLAGLAAILPRDGAGRSVEVVIAAGNYAEDIRVALNNISGYESIIVRGTVTSTTAGCVAFDGSLADLKMSGAVTVTGGNAPGYNFAAGTTREISLTKVGGGNPNFLADQTFGGICPFGWRIRFDANTTTAALRNVCRQICRVTGTDTVKFGKVLPAVPGITDTCYVEMAGVNASDAGFIENWSGGPNDAPGMVLAGIQTTLQWFASDCNLTFVLCGAEKVSAGVDVGETNSNLTCRGFYAHPILGTVTVGGGLRCYDTFDSFRGRGHMEGLVVGQGAQVNESSSFTFGGGCSAGNLNISASALGSDEINNGEPNVGTNSTNLNPLFVDTPPRLFAASIRYASLLISGSTLRIGDMTIENANGSGATLQGGIGLVDQCQVVVSGLIAGTSGNTDVGIILTASAGSTIEFQQTPTMTGTLGDILLAGSQIATYAHIVLEEIYDTAENHLFQVTTPAVLGGGGGVSGAVYGHTIDPSVMTGVVTGAAVTDHALVRITAAGLVELARADTAADSSGFVGVSVGAALAAAPVLVAGFSGLKIVNFDAAAPTPGLPAYLSPTTAGAATVTAPSVSQITIPIGIVTQAVAGNLAVVAMNPQAAPSTALTAANWTLGISRIYAVDFVNGIDTNKGFADPATSSAADYAVACAAAGAVAVKTFAGLAAIFPKYGNGRQVEVVIANGGVNTAQNYADSIATFLNGCDDWFIDSPLVRGTGTNTTAGAVAFDGSANDVTYQGGITVPGLNAPGYNPTGAATTTSLVCLQVGGAAPAFPAEPASPLGWRVRFDANTTTVVLRNQCRQIAQVTGAADTIIPQTAFSAVPVAGDVFYVEQAGITFGACTLSGVGIGGNSSVSANVSGMRSTSTWSSVDCKIAYSFCGANAFNASSLALSTIRQTIFHPARGARTVGGGVRCETSSLMNSSGGNAFLNGLVCATSFNPTFFSQIQWGVGCFCGTVLQFFNMTQPLGIDANTPPGVGTSTALAQPRAQRIQVRASQLTLGGSTYAGAGANPAILVGGRCCIVFANGVVAGTTGNNDVGLDLTGSRGSLIIIAITPTVTGALGDVRLAGGQIITWAQAIATGITDSAGNRIIGTAGTPPLSITQFAGSVIGAAGAVVSYLADTGPVAVNQVVPLRRPTSLRLCTRLRVTNLVNTSANAVTVTLYKNAVATAMQVAIPAATAANTKFSDTAHPILFLDGDDYDLRMDDGADVAGVVSVSAALEWAV